MAKSFEIDLKTILLYEEIIDSNASLFVCIQKPWRYADCTNKSSAVWLVCK